jgi:hypothetical protein
MAVGIGDAYGLIIKGRVRCSHWAKCRLSPIVAWWWRLVLCDVIWSVPGVRDVTADLLRHFFMEFTPFLIGCVISSGNHSFEIIRQSRDCVINRPTTKASEVVVEIGNTSGAEID